MTVHNIESRVFYLKSLLNCRLWLEMTNCSTATDTDCVVPISQQVAAGTRNMELSSTNKTHSLLFLQEHLPLLDTGQALHFCVFSKMAAAAILNFQKVLFWTPCRPSIAHIYQHTKFGAN